VEKVCSRCKVSKDAGEFSKLQWWCKSCCAAYRAARKKEAAVYNAAYRRGEGPRGLITRMEWLLGRQRRKAKDEGYAPPDTTPEEMVKMWEDQKGRCAITGRPITLFNCHISHDHDTGKVHGFVLNHVNTLEGHIKDLTREEILVIYDFYRPAPKPTSPQPI